MEIMDYEKIVKQMIADEAISKEVVEKYCSELKKESEDEKTKRILLSISSKMSFHLRDIFTEEEFQCFDAWSNAWLEKQGEKKSTEWSEEDETVLNNLIYALANDKIGNNRDEYVDWLKSLKDRFTWQPSDEHYDLEEFAKIVRGNLTGISKAVQKLFEAKYLQLTGKKMYGGFKD